MISSVPNQKVQAMKDRLTPIPQPPQKKRKIFGLYSENTAKCILKYIIQNPGTSNRVIQDFLGLSNPCVTTITKALAEIGCLKVSVNGRAKSFVFVKLPDGWQMEDVKSAVFEKNKKEAKPVSDTKEEKPLISVPKYLKATSILESTKTIPYDSVASYQQLLKDTTKYYGVAELDDLVGEIHRFLKARIESTVLRCPVCNSIIKTEKSTVFCPTCQMSISMGTADKSVKALLKYGKLLKGVQ